MLSFVTNPDTVAPLFAGCAHTMVRSCLQGIMGRLYASGETQPDAAMAVLGDFVFLAGKARAAFLLDFQRQLWDGSLKIFVPCHPHWNEAIETAFSGQWKKAVRYAFEKDPQAFDTKKLQSFSQALPEGFRLTAIGEAWFSYCKNTAWCRDFVSQYGDYPQYAKHGLGVLAIKDGVPASGASSYSGYEGGIEIQIETREDFRRRGLAAACGAALILACLKRGLSPSWDAHNPESAALAQKLGYRPSRQYLSYHVSDKE